MRLSCAGILGGVFGALVASAPAARAQKAGGSSIAPWVGVNFATASATNNPGVTWGTHTGFAGGVQLQHELTNTVFVRAGVLYSMRGAKATAQGTTGTFKINYVEIPVVAGYDFASPEARVVPFVYAGGQFAFKTGCTAEGAGQIVSCDNFLGSSVSGTDLGLTFGAGVTFPAGNGQLDIDARYLLGLTNLESGATTSSSVKNRGFTVGVGYFVPFGRKD
jgi:Outer membrane protein beta-barrel domain